MSKLLTAPGASTSGASMLRALQRQAGNRAVTALLASRSPATSRPPSTPEPAGPQSTSPAPAESSAPVAEVPATLGVIATPDLPGFAPPDEPAPGRGRRTATRSASLQRDAESGDGSGGEGGGLLNGILGRVKGVVTAVRSGWDQLSSAGGQALSAVQERAGSAVSGLAQLGASAGQALNTAVTTATSAAGKLSDSLLAGVRAGLGTVTAAAGGLGAAVHNLDGPAMQASWTRLTGALNGVWQQVQSGAAAISSQLSALTSGVQQRFDGLASGLSDRASALGEQIRGAATAAKDRVLAAWTSLQSKGGGIADLAAKLPSSLRGLAERALSGARAVWASVQQSWQQLQTRLSGLADTVMKSVADAATAAKGALSTAWAGLRSQLAAGQAKVTSTVTGLVERVRAQVTQFKGAAVGSAFGQIGKIVTLYQNVKKLSGDPQSVVMPYITKMAGLLGAQMPARAVAEGKQLVPAGGAAPAAANALPVQRLETGGGDARSTAIGSVWSPIWSGIVEKFSSVEIIPALLHTLYVFFLPFGTIWGEIQGVWTDWKASANSLFTMRGIGENFLGWLHDLYANVLRLVDFPFDLLARLSNILVLLTGPLTIILTILGAVGGTFAGTVIGAILGALGGGIPAAALAPGGGLAGGAAGAGVGFAAAMGIGEVAVGLFIGTQSMSFARSIAELATGRLTELDKIREWSRAADNLIAIGVTIVLAAAGHFGARAGGVIAKLAAAILPKSILKAAAAFKGGYTGARAALPKGPAVDPAFKPANFEVKVSKPEMLTFDAEARVDVTETATGNKGYIIRKYDRINRRLIYDESDLGMIKSEDRWIQPAEDAEKVRLESYMTRRAMKEIERQLNDPSVFVGARKVAMRNVVFKKQVLSMAKAEKAGGKAGRAAELPKSPSVEYVRNTVEAEGGQITKVIEHSGRSTSAKSISTDPVELAPLEPDELITTATTIEIDVQPVGPSSGRPGVPIQPRKQDED